jgi:adenosylcobinamide-phosphate synthase
MILIPILIIVGAVILDIAFGDPKSKFHPTAWVGYIIARLVPLIKEKTSTVEKLGGVCITLCTTTLVAIVLISYELFTKNLLDIISTIIVILLGSLLLKTTIAIRGLERHGMFVMDALSKNNLEDARQRLSMLVKRNTKNLDRNHIVSGVLESTSENIVDGVTGPLFYFALFGLPGAFVYRTVNTIDSMVGYQNTLFRNIGWFGANCDKILNYLPARITAYVMILAAAFIGADWKNSLTTIRQDGRKTQSINAGYPMAAMAGALGTRFEKIDHYSLGNGTTDLDENHFRTAILLMKMTCLLFCAIITIPLITILYSVGWWIHV